MSNDRGGRAWRAAKDKQTSRVRPTLDRPQRIEFLELVAQMSSRITFERKLGLNAADVEFYKREFDVESPDEARRLARSLRTAGDDEREARMLEETQKARDAEEIAQARLEALEAKKVADAASKPARKVDVNKVRQEDAERQRRFAEQQAGVEKPDRTWELPMEEGQGSRAEQIDRFRRDLVYHGLSFVRRKHGATAQQARYEAARLGIKVNWDIIRK